MTRLQIRVSGRRHLWIGALAVAASIAAPACDTALEVEDPTAAAPGTVAIEAAVPTTLNAAIGDFQLAFSGAPGGGSFIDSQVTTSGILSDEFVISESFPTRIDVDQRDTKFENGTMLQVYARLHTARRLAEFSADLHGKFPATTNTAGQAHALDLAAYTYVVFGENYCSGVPFSTFDDAGVVQYGPPMTTAEMFEHAVTVFDQAITTATAAGATAVDQLNLARVGKGRALLNLNQPAAAAAAVASVPTSFVYRIFHSTGTARQNNGIWGANQNRRGVSIADVEGVNGMAYRADNDPRVRQARGTGTSAFGFDNTTPLFLQQKYPAQASSIILASGLEARLIEAENLQRAGGDWLGTLNALRTSPPSYYPVTEFPDIGKLTALVDPTANAARVDLLFKEREYWLWLTSHRVGDLRRLMRQYGRTVAQAGWPTGSYFRGGTYGTHVSMLVPFDELNNPQFKTAFPNGCDASVP